MRNNAFLESRLLAADRESIGKAHSVKGKPRRVEPNARSVATLDAPASWGIGSSSVKSYYKNPQESASQVIFRPKAAKPGFFGGLLREIFAYNHVAAAKAVRRASISCNKPGV